MTTSIPAPFHSGKVRDHYLIDDVRMLMVASDRLSAHDVVFEQLIPGKGRVLTALTEFWLTRLFTDIPHHLVTTDMSQLPIELRAIPDLDGRGMIVNLAKMLPIECIVRGYLTGSGYKEYAKTGAVCGIQLPPGLLDTSRLPEPIFTPSTKATTGHDVNINEAAARAALLNVGCSPDLYDRAVAICLDVYERAAAYALARGIIIADTKLELGLVNGVLTLCDEVLTPDSSRFWEADSWEPGRAPVSLDKQPVRDWAVRTGWNLKPPAPLLPPEVVAATSARYQYAQMRLVAA
jgi:phosphoribosylaminoimidazole-succinocarboxamide synthase